jgi:hypothetical protein
MADLVPVLMS